MKLQKRILCACVCLVLLIAPPFTAQGSSREDLEQSINQLQQAQEQLQQQMDDAQNEQTTVQDQLNKTQEQVQSLEAEKKKLQENIKAFDDQLGVVTKELADITAAQEAKQQEIADNQVVLEAATQEEKIQYENMKKRIRYMYEKGNQSYLEVLLSAADATDLLAKAEYVNKILKYDRKMLENYQQARNAVEQQKTLLAQENQELEQLKTDAAARQASMEQLLAQKNQELEKYNQTIRATKSLAQQYEEQIAYQEAVINEIEAAVLQNAAQQNQAYSQLQALLAQGNAAAEQQAAQAVLAQLAAQEQAKLESSGAQGGYNLIIDPNSLFVWPCPASTRITSEYGMRPHPIYGDYRFHSGIDIGAAMGSAIVAAYQGTVISAGYNSSMGNYVMIDHGQGLVTIYMHASYLCVSQGDAVKTGQLIALVGSTGDSTGPHLHFTTRLNGNYVSPWNYVSY